ncbi:MAG: phosphoribosylamine--glycine ligase [Trueperaceae bacterium]|nr:phosphoribosylamine--glycine ligase [Trueperaceae bacterium]
MKLLIVGGGGREHALAWRLAQSPRVTEILVTPGNGGTATLVKTRNVSSSDGTPLEIATREKVDLTIVGPEAPLSEGIVDRFQEAGLSIYGPSQQAARLEASKAFAKEFMVRHDIPTARFATFREVEGARAYLARQSNPVVIKGSGLAGGKAVLLPDSKEDAADALQQLMVERRFGAAGDEVVIEERLSGPEVSLLAFSDGTTVLPMPPAQDHKRAFEGDEGPNTGGMGAYAPAPVCPPTLQRDIVATVLQPAIDGLRSEGCPFVGVLYAGLMLTGDGPKTLEFNCRFGDPEAQVLLPLLESDLLDIIEASLAGRLGDIDALRWRAGAAATVVLASGGYPESYEIGKEIGGLEHATHPGVVFHAGTRQQNGKLLTYGGRVLNVTGLGTSLDDALKNAYANVDAIRFDGMHYRRDIGAKARAQTA